ncbi:tetratricopeptide repeat protein 25 [Plakobranchus ocellatus]|uniref:Outer dynein arm-docking complex subunit 4 n=1 Tax=Plakobranchus ocellatus TaxID=259542 RepID=A0AAV3ZZB7_9GAST|nr:tetratricopeptide repeat protein 25 [Plakobranchus ocellatus]
MSVPDKAPDDDDFIRHHALATENSCISSREITDKKWQRQTKNNSDFPFFPLVFSQSSDTMARIPPSNIGPKHLGGRVGAKGPASTKTLTTNTFTTTTGVSSTIHDPSVPRTYLFDIYKNEAESHFEIGEYRLAADCYNAAIKLQPTDTAAIVARSRCYTQMGRWKRAMKDCDEALSIDPAYPEALYQKAEILYINGNYDLAHVYFKRGLRQQPDSMLFKHAALYQKAEILYINGNYDLAHVYFKRGLRQQPDSMLFKHAVQKASDAIHKHGPSAVPTKPTKLTAVGDLTMFLHSKQRRNLQREPTRVGALADDDDGNKLDLPSAGFRARFNVGPLVRINRKPGVSILRAYRPESARSDTSAASATRMPDESTMRCILGELYGDRKYLKMFQNSLPGGKAERDLTLLADEGLEFLRERTMFWDSLGPLPPPQVEPITFARR